MINIINKKVEIIAFNKFRFEIIYDEITNIDLSSLDIKQCKNYIKSIDECLEFFGHLDIEDYEKCNKLFDIKTKILE